MTGMSIIFTSSRTVSPRRITSGEAPEGRQLEKPLRPDGFAPFLIRLLGMAQGYGSNPSGPPSLQPTARAR